MGVGQQLCTHGRGIMKGGEMLGRSISGRGYGPQVRDPDLIAVKNSDLIGARSVYKTKTSQSHTSEKPAWHPWESHNQS